MPSNDFSSANGNIALENRRPKHDLDASSSNKNKDSSHTDFILVYNCTEVKNEGDIESNHDNNSTTRNKVSDRRKRFEQHLIERQGLHLDYAVSRLNNNKIIFVNFSLSRNPRMVGLSLLKFILHLICSCLLLKICE